MKNLTKIQLKALLKKKLREQIEVKSGILVAMKSYLNRVPSDLENIKNQRVTSRVVYLSTLFLTTLIISLFFNSQEAMATSTQPLENPDFIVKTYSRVCASPMTEMRGSATLFSYAGEAYAISSEHVFYHSKKSTYCHELENQKLGRVSASMLWADWGLGLALLKVNLTKTQLKRLKVLQFPQDFVSELHKPDAHYEENDPTSLESFGSLAVSGFAYGDHVPLVNLGGQIINPLSRRHLFALIDHVYEVSGIHGEFGMSGGALLSVSENHGTSRRNWCYLGLLSHQVLNLVPGGPSRISEGPNHETTNNLLLIIPAYIITQTLQKYFVEPKTFTVSFYRDPEQQWNLREHKSETAIVSNGFLFFSRFVEPNVIDESIGGGLSPRLDFSTNLREIGTPIGGTDPIGIGGLVDELGPHVELEVELISEVHEEFPTEWRWPQYEHQLDQIRAILFRHGLVSIPYLVLQNPEEMVLTVQQVQSMAQFFSFLNQRKYQPVIEDKNTSLDNHLAEKKQGEQLTELLTVFEVGQLSKENLSQWISLKNVAYLMFHGHKSLINCRILDDLVDTKSNHDFWDEILKKNFLVGVDILRNLKSIAHSCPM